VEITMYSSINDLQTKLQSVLTVEKDHVLIKDENLLRETAIDELISTAIFSPDQTIQTYAKSLIKQLAFSLSIIPSSIFHFYIAIGKGEITSAFTTPAFNLRTITYDNARIIFRLTQQKHIGAFIFEIARSEMEYTFQKPKEYEAAILAAAIKEGYSGPVFLQGDHIQFSKKRFSENPREETAKIKNLVKECIEASFYNIDIDASTLVDLSKENLDEQQKINYEVTAEMTAYIRSIQPTDTIVSIGAEIGHIGGVNSKSEDFEAFMRGYTPLIQKQNLNGISKISVQTGTSHGGIPLPDGTVAEVKLDFNVLKTIGELAKKNYHIGGSVQHGASTLPHELFGEFPKNNTVEIHLATGFQNIVYDYLPVSLKKTVYDWIDQNLQNEKEEGWTHDQFIYKTRKKALGPFKQQLWEMPEKDKQPILNALEKEFLLLFDKLQVANTIDLVKPYVSTHNNPN